jgi:hypothetical protein
MNSSGLITSKSTGLIVLVVVTVKEMKWRTLGTRAKEAYSSASVLSIATWSLEVEVEVGGL